MRIWGRIFLGTLLLVGIGLSLLVRGIVDELEPEYRKTTEELMVDIARSFAAVAGASATNEEVDVQLFRDIFKKVRAQSFSAKIYDFEKTSVDFRLYLTDRAGIVLFDSNAGKDEGKDYSTWRDVALTLNGEYGARTSRDSGRDTTLSTMYVAAPIMSAGNIIGVVSVGKSVQNSNYFVEKSKRRILVGGVIIFVAMILVSIVLSGMLSRPIGRLMQYARSIRDGKRVALPELGTSEISELGQAFEEMLDTIEGKKYIEHYVQTLTHEVKSPLSAIKGAVELLRERLPEEKRAQFLQNIETETERIENVVEKLLLLSSLESQKELRHRESILLSSLLAEVEQSVSAILENKKITFALDVKEDLSVSGERHLVYHAVSNLVQNALDFTPNDGSIKVTIEKDHSAVVLRVEDSGSGIPDYAKDRVFERFYSLKRPGSGRKSSGLGLSLVNEVMELHQGKLEISSSSLGGVMAVLFFT